MKDFIKLAISLVVIGYIIYFFVAIGGVVFSTISGTWDYYTYQLVIVSIMIVSLLLIYNYNRRTKKAIKDAEDDRKRNASELRAKEQNYNRFKRELEKEFKEITEETDKLEEAYNQVMKTSNPFRHVAEMYADWETIVYEKTTHFLRTKKHPAVKRSEDVKNLKEKTKEAVRNYKEMKYKYLFLLDAFPELKQYVDDEEALAHLADYKDYEDFKAERDEVFDWVSPEEYRNMSEIKRNQLALDRYKKGKKSDWQVGMEYEMYVGHLLRENKFSVIQYGIENGLNDLGRDIIASRVENGVRFIYIIQCKNWAKGRPVHENVVCQLYGTAVQYELTNKNLFFQETKIVPWLVITNKLSDMAQKFANKLGVLVSVRPLKDFPMIKCNINNGNKIYHLPFDQQYYRTEIKLPGEFYAWTVQEAVDAGFRRARRHMFNE